MLAGKQVPRKSQARPRWLTDPEQCAWRAFLQASHLLLDQLDRELRHDAGMTHAYYAVLVALSEQPEQTIRMTDLAQLLLFSKTRLSEAVARLEARGWIRRERCEADRRLTYAVLTDDGFEALKSAAPGHVDGVRRHVFDLLTPEQVDQLEAICLAIATPLCEQAVGYQPSAVSNVGHPT